MATGFLPRIQPREEPAGQTTRQKADAGGSQRHTPGRAGQQADCDTFLKLPHRMVSADAQLASRLRENQGAGHGEQVDEAATGVLLKYSQ
jgi:hypothetical protein